MPPTSPRPPGPDPAGLLARLVAPAGRAERVTHVEHVPARAGRTVAWPGFVPPLLRDRLALRGVSAPWEHQAEAAELAWSGRSVVVATGTASGKSLAYLLPVLSAVLHAAGETGGGETGGGEGDGDEPDGRPVDGRPGGAQPRGAARTGRAGRAARPPRATALYLAPTKALAADQLRAVRSLALAQVRAATFDGDTPREERDWVRAHADLVLTNPDMLHRSVLPGHGRWASFLRALRFVVVDEAHVYRGVFGSHVAQVLRRLLRVAARYGAQPVVVLASATSGSPGESATRLVGRPVAEVSRDASPRGPAEFALWEPPLTELRGEQGAPVRRTATAESADLLADLVVEGARTLAFVRSRRGAETVALGAQRALAEVDGGLARRVSAYRAGYLPEERRALEERLHRGSLLGVAATNALELGVDIAGLDAVLLAGYPGTVASLWQQAGRAGRAGQPALAVLVARDDPLDTYLVHHPRALFDRPVEVTVTDPENPHVLGPHLCCAAAELPLTEADLALFGGDAARAAVDDLVRRGLLRRRPAGWFWTRHERPGDALDLRGTGGEPVRVVEAGTGRLLGTVDAGAAHGTVHEGAVYLHQGESYVVRELDLDASVALVVAEAPDWSTSARDVTDIAVVEELRARQWPDLRVSFGTVDVTNQVVSYLRKRLGSGEVLGEVPLDLPPRQLRTRAVWWSVTPALLETAEVEPADVPGAAHAAEHASIGLLPLVATCDRWDIGGVSTALHADTGRATVFVYDGHPGGAGFAARAYEAAATWLTSTRDAVAACECEAGCPSCVQSPKCGNGNDPLDKAAAVRLLDAVLAAGLAAGPERRLDAGAQGAPGAAGAGEAGGGHAAAGAGPRDGGTR